MAQEVYEQLLEYAGKLHVPPNPKITPSAVRAYDEALDVLLTFRGRSDVLIQALHAFIATGSLPYAYAGLAQCVGFASYESDRNYTSAGIAQALAILRQAQMLSPNRLQIDSIEAYLYLNIKDTQQARRILDSFGEAGKTSYFVGLAELYYWELIDNLLTYKIWYERVLALAQTQARVIWVKNACAAHFMVKGMYAEFIDITREVAVFTPNDPWLWHNLSIALMRMNRYKEAREANKRALRLMDFVAARRVEQQIKERSGFGFFGR